MGLSWPLPSGLDDEALRARLYPAPDQDSDRTQPDWDVIVEALTAPRKRRRARLTRRQLWVEYRDEALAQGGKAYTYSRFCGLLKERLHSRPRPAQMCFHYEPGLWGLSDFSGKTLALRTGRGEKDVEIFVAVLAHSNLTYVEAVPDPAEIAGVPARDSPIDVGDSDRSQGNAPFVEPIEEAVDRSTAAMHRVFRPSALFMHPRRKGRDLASMGVPRPFGLLQHVHEAKPP